MTEALTYLVVDDDESFRVRLGRALEARGNRVLLAASGPEALPVARAERPRRAIVDLRMEGPSGLDVLRDLRDIDPEMEIVILTGFGSIATAVEAMRAGAVNYVSKPADTDEILAAFAEASEAEPAGEFARRPSLARVEWEYINQVLSECGGNVSEAARRMGMHRRTLQRKLSKYPPPEERGD